MIYYKSHFGKTITYLMLSFFILLIVGEIVLILNFDHSNSNRWYTLIGGSVLVSFFAYVLSASLLKIFIRFYVTSEGLKVTYPFHQTLFVSKNEVEDIVSLAPEQALKVYQESIEDQQQFSDGADLFGYIKYVKENKYKYKYLSVAPRGRVKTVGPKETIVDMDLVSEHQFVMIRLKNGKYYFFAPVQSKDFVSDCKNQWGVNQ